MKNFKLVLVSLFAISLLGSCGGGSSSARVVEEISSTMEGVAVDDLIVNGIITGYTNANAKLAATRSDQNASYRLVIKDYMGLVVVEVTCDKDSIMSALDGTQKACPLNTRLRSFGVTSGRTTPVVANISPLTEMVYQRALELSSGLGSITEATFELARAQIGEIFGVDPINDDPAKGIYGSIINAILDVADDQNKTTQEIVDEIAKDISDGTAGDSNTTKDLSDAIKDNNVSNNLTQNDGSYTPSTGDNTTDSNNDGSVTQDEAISYAKGMFKDLRTSTLALVDYETAQKSGTVDVEVVGFGEVVNEFGVKFDTAAIYKSAVLNVIFDAIELGKIENFDIIGDGAGMNIKVSKTSATTWSYQFGKDNLYKGSVTVPTDMPQNYLESNLYVQLSFKFDGTLPAYRYSDVVNSKEINEIGIQSLKGDLSVINSSGLIKTILTNGVLQSDNQILTVTKMVTQSKTLSGGEYAKLEEVVFNGTIKHYQVDARIDIPSYAINSNIIENGGYMPEQIVFNGYILNTQNQTKMNAQIVANWKDVKLVTQATLDDEGYDPLLKLNINGTIKVANQAENIVNFEFENFTDGSQKAKIYYTGDGMVANATLSFTSQEQDNGTVIVTNNLGIKGSFTLHNGLVVVGDINGNGSIVTKDGTLIGVVDYREGVLIVKYTDGSFESLY